MTPTTTYADHPLADELRWYLHREYEGEMGRRSTAGGQLDTIERGCSVPSEGTGEPGERALRAARKLDVVESAWRRLPLAHRDTLKSAFGARSLAHLTGLDPEYALEGYQPRLVDKRIPPDLVPIVGTLLDGRLAAEEHRRAGTRLSVADWLRHLQARVRKRRQHRELIPEGRVLRRLLEDAARRIDAALVAYDDERRRGPSTHHRVIQVERRERRRVTVRRWLRMSEVRAALGVSQQRAATLFAEGRFKTTRRLGRGRTAPIEVAACCVEALRKRATCGDCSEAA